jgi:hypothetical protein
MSFATWDASRKGSGVTLTGGNLIATMSGGLYMVAATDPIDISASSHYAEFAIDAGTSFIGFGLVKAGTLTDQYLGAYDDQLSLWMDGSYDKQSAGITVDSNIMVYAPGDTIKILVENDKIYMGKVGVGWWNPPANDYVSTPAAECASGFSAGNWSLGTSTINDGKCTGNFGASAFGDTPPAGSVGWPAGGGTSVGLSGSGATSSAGTPASKHAATASGTAATPSAGTAKAKHSLAAAGAAATSASGTAKARHAPTASGAAATASAGTSKAARVIMAAGLAATVAAGTLSPHTNVSVGLTGQAAAASAGTLSPHTGVTVALTGVAATSAAGSVVRASAFVLSGSGATATADSIQWADREVAITGTAASSGAGSPSPVRSVPLAGAGATGSAGTVTTGGSAAVALTGQAAATATGTASVGARSLALSGAEGTSTAGTVTPRTARVQALAGTAAAAGTGALGVSHNRRLAGTQAIGTAGALPGFIVTPKLVSFTAENIGTMCTLTAENIGSVCILTVTDLD